MSLIDLEDKETISNQLLDIYLNDSDLIDKNIIKKYLENLNLPQSNSHIFEKFIKYWTILDETASELTFNHHSEDGIIRHRHIGNKFQLLHNDNLITTSELDEILRLRSLRNELVHNLKVPNVSLNDFEKIKTITTELISKINTPSLKKKLQKN